MISLVFFFFTNFVAYMRVYFYILTGLYKNIYRYKYTHKMSFATFGERGNFLRFFFFGMRERKKKF